MNCPRGSAATALQWVEPPAPTPTPPAPTPEQTTWRHLDTLHRVAELVDRIDTAMREERERVDARLAVLRTGELQLAAALCALEQQQKAARR
jgi:hypothetical protein